MSDAELDAPFRRGFDTAIAPTKKRTVTDETHSKKAETAVSLWEVSVGTVLKPIRVRGDRSVKAVVAAVAEELKKHYQNPTEARAGRVGR